MHFSLAVGGGSASCCNSYSSSGSKCKLSGSPNRLFCAHAPNIGRSKQGFVRVTV